MKIAHLFAVPFAEFVLPPERHELLGQLAALFIDREQAGDQYRNHTQRSTQQGALFESTFDLFKWPEPVVRELAGFCHRSLTQLINRTTDYSPEELHRLHFEYHAWFHVTRNGGFQGLHNHQNASWSGVFCVDPGDTSEKNPDSGAVRFHDPRGMADMYLDAGNQRLAMPANQGVFQVQHAPGKLVIFPSYLLHEIFAYVGQRPRIVVAFNCMMRMK